MNLDGEMVINAPRQAVWEALNDPKILARCVEGCERLEPIDENQFVGDLKVQVGPIRARFSGQIELKDIVAPTSYTLVGSGKGGASGFASGEARVNLLDRDDGTLLQYVVEARVGGKLAQIGGKLIESTTRQHAAKFFARLKQTVEPTDEGLSESAAVAVADAAGEKPRGLVVPGLLLLAALAVAALAYALVLR